MTHTGPVLLSEICDTSAPNDRSSVYDRLRHPRFDFTITMSREQHDEYMAQFTFTREDPQ